jgi:hypothetical protein
MEESNGMQFYSNIPTPADTWEPLRTNYLAVTSTNIPEYKEARKVFSNNIDEPLTTGFEVPIEIKYNEKLGRAVYATEFIKEGTYVYNPKNIAEFHPPTDFRKFIDRIKDPEFNNNNRHIQSLACDSIIWSSMEITNRYDKKDKMVCLSFDEGSLLNNGFTNYTANNLIKHTIMDNDNGKKTIDEERFTCRDRGFYAKRDIQAGEGTLHCYNTSVSNKERHDDDYGLFACCFSIFVTRRVFTENSAATFCLLTSNHNCSSTFSCLASISCQQTITPILYFTILYHS